MLSKMAEATSANFRQDGVGLPVADQIRPIRTRFGPFGHRVVHLEKALKEKADRQVETQIIGIEQTLSEKASITFVKEMHDQAMAFGQTLEEKLDDIRNRVQKLKQAKDTQVVREPLHRTLSAQPPCLRKQDSRKRRDDHRIDIEAARVTEHRYTPVLAKEFKEFLYEARPEDAVECDICGERYRRPQGRLCGAPGRPWSVQENFICRWCFDALAGPPPATVLQPAVEEYLSEAADALRRANQALEEELKKNKQVRKDQDYHSHVEQGARDMATVRQMSELADLLSLYERTNTTIPKWSKDPLSEKLRRLHASLEAHLTDLRFLGQSLGLAERAGEGSSGKGAVEKIPQKESDVGKSSGDDLLQSPNSAPNASRPQEVLNEASGEVAAPPVTPVSRLTAAPKRLKRKRKAGEVAAPPVTPVSKPVAAPKRLKQKRRVVESDDE